MSEEKQSIKTPVNIKAIKNKAKKFVMVNKLSPLGLYALNLLAMGFFIILGVVIPGNFGWFVLVPLLLYYFLYSAVIFSNTDFYLRSYNLQFSESFKFFEGFKKENIFRAFGLHLIFTGFGSGYLVAALVGLTVSLLFYVWVGVLIAIGIAVIFTIPAAYIFARGCFAYHFLVINEKTSAWRAIKLSFAATKQEGRTLIVLRLFLSYMGWFALGFVTAGLVFIYAIPHWQTAKAILFRQEILEVDDKVSLKELSEHFKSPLALEADADEVIIETVSPLQAREQALMDAKYRAARKKAQENSAAQAAYAVAHADNNFEEENIVTITKIKKTKKEKKVPKSLEILGDDFDTEVVAVKELIAKSNDPETNPNIKPNAHIASQLLELHDSSLDVLYGQSPVNSISAMLTPIHQDSPLAKELEIREGESFTVYRERVKAAREQAMVSEVPAMVSPVDTIPVQIVNSVPSTPRFKVADMEQEPAKIPKTKVPSQMPKRAIGENVAPNIASQNRVMSDIIMQEPANQGQNVQNQASQMQASGHRQYDTQASQSRQQTQTLRQPIQERPNQAVFASSPNAVPITNPNIGATHSQQPKQQVQSPGQQGFSQNTAFANVVGQGVPRMTNGANANASNTLRQTYPRANNATPLRRDSVLGEQSAGNVAPMQNNKPPREPLTPYKNVDKVSPSPIRQHDAELKNNKPFGGSGSISFGVRKNDSNSEKIKPPSYIKPPSNASANNAAQENKKLTREEILERLKKSREDRVVKKV